MDNEPVDHVSHPLDLDDLGHNMENQVPSKFVEMHEFHILVTRTAPLEKQLKNVNANLMHVMNRLHELIFCKHALGNASKPMVIEGDTKLPPLIGNPFGFILLPSLSSNDSHNMLESTKPPTCHGEEWEH